MVAPVQLLPQIEPGVAGTGPRIASEPGKSGFTFGSVGRTHVDVNDHVDVIGRVGCRMGRGHEVPVGMAVGWRYQHRPERIQHGRRLLFDPGEIFAMLGGRQHGEALRPSNLLQNSYARRRRSLLQGLLILAEDCLAAVGRGRSGFDKRQYPRRL